MKYIELRGRIVEKFGTIGNFCKAVEISRAMMSLKLNGHAPFTQQQIADWSKLLDIPMKDIGKFFFNSKL